MIKEGLPFQMHIIQREGKKCFDKRRDGHGNKTKNQGYDNKNLQGFNKGQQRKRDDIDGGLLEECFIHPKGLLSGLLALHGHKKLSSLRRLIIGQDITQQDNKV